MSGPGGWLLTSVSGFCAGQDPIRVVFGGLCIRCLSCFCKFPTYRLFIARTLVTKLFPQLKVIGFGKTIKIPDEVFKENQKCYQTNNYFKRQNGSILVTFLSLLALSFLGCIFLT